MWRVILAKLTSEPLAITPTATGVEQVNRAIKVVEAVDKRFFGPLGSDLASLIQMMRQLIR